MDDEKIRRQKAIDDWLPITSSRNAKWWYSAFHNVTAMVGAGVLSLPYAMAHLGWGPGVAVLILSWIITLYTLWQMVEMHEMVPGKRFDRYHELGQHAFGEKLGLYIVVPQQLIVEVSVNIVYMVTGGKSLKKFHDVVCKDCKDIKLTYFIMIFASVHFVLSHLPNFNSISGVSLCAAVMSLSYSTIAWSASVDKGVQSDVDYSYKATTNTGVVLDFFTALGDVAFAYAGHNVVLEIQATIPSTPEKPSKGPMWRGVIVAYIVVALCYFPVALIGYWIFGNQVEDNILISLEKPAWLIGMANLFVVVHVIGSYQIYAMPVFDMIETVLVKKLNFRPTFMLRFITRNLYVALTMFIGMTFPFFGGLLGFFGGFAFAPTTYFKTDQELLKDVNLDKQKDIDDWLPITSSRNAKWWYAAFHNVTAMVGAGVLSLPFAMSQLGWGPGVVIMILSWVITLFTLWQMVQMHEMVPGRRFDRYHELGQYAFGEKLGLWIVVPQQLICEVGVDIVYMVTGGKSLQKVYLSVCEHKKCTHINLTEFIMIFASCHFFLAHLPNFNSISGVSLAAAVMSLSYSTIAWGASVHRGVQPDVTYNSRASNTKDGVFNFLSALGDVAFAYAGHNVVLEIQATIPSTPEKPSKGPMWNGVLIAYLVVALCYFPVAFIGYYVFGDKIDDNILITLEKPKWLIITANMFVVVHVIGSYQLYAMPVFDMIETVLVKKLKFRPTWYLRFISRNVYVGFTMFIGMTFPFFGGLLGFFGGFAFSPTTYFLPCIMWLAIYKPKKFSPSWLINWICITLGVLLMILSPIGGMATIVKQAKDYKFYS
uniref:Amino acid transporter transmembrane domain-containing protein n=1 Tax=Cannabis sativa TaxID=3483 RepID=A0A803QL86_CANSA